MQIKFAQFVTRIGYVNRAIIARLAVVWLVVGRGVAAIFGGCGYCGRAVRGGDGCPCGARVGVVGGGGAVVEQGARRVEIEQARGAADSTIGRSVAAGGQKVQSLAADAEGARGSGGARVAVNELHKECGGGGHDLSLPACWRRASRRVLCQSVIDDNQYNAAEAAKVTGAVSRASAQTNPNTASSAGRACNPLGVQSGLMGHPSACALGGAVVVASLPLSRLIEARDFGRLVGWEWLNSVRRCVGPHRPSAVSGASAMFAARPGGVA